MTMMKNKQCICCEIYKPKCNFEFRKDTGKYRNTCRDCGCLKMRNRRNSNKELTNAKNREYRTKNPEKVRAYGKKSYNKNKAKYKQTRKRWRENNKNYLKKYSLEYRKKNADRISSYESSDRRKASRRLNHYRYEKERLANDTHYKLQKNLRARLRSAIKNNYKTGSAISDLGCSIEELRQHLEAQFKPGMAWENYGKWHIDHIKPLSQFDLTNPDQVKIACHYTNLQPLWAKENLSKGNRKI